MKYTPAQLAEHCPLFCAHCFASGGELGVARTPEVGEPIEYICRACYSAVIVTIVIPDAVEP